MDIGHFSSIIVRIGHRPAERIAAEAIMEHCRAASNWRSLVCFLFSMPVFVPNRFPGKLIVVEGIDGSGKSTQLSLLSQWLRSQGYAVAFSEWNSSPLVKQTTRRGKRKEMFTPTTFSLIHATDFADRLEGYIQPLLQAGAIVCADRYAYTAFAREIGRASV